MLPSSVPAAVLINLASGAPTSPTLPSSLPAPVRAPRGRRIELPSAILDSSLRALQLATLQISKPTPDLLH